MEIIVLVFLLVLLHMYLFYIRYIKFYSKPKNIRPHNGNEILSPVNGRVVYIRKYDCEITHDKLGRKLSIEVPEHLLGREFVQIGIYMSPFNNHHIITPENETPSEVKRISGSLEDMLSPFDHLIPYANKIFANWFDKKDFVKINERDNIVFKDYFMTLIYDKYVNKITPINETIKNRTILYFVHRGSQMDVFLSVKYPIKVSVGDKVNFNTLLARRLND